MAKRTKGQCIFCKKSYTKGGMKRHLPTCQDRLAAQHSVVAGKSTTLYHLAVEATYIPDYWLHLEIPANLTLQDLDQFLRAIWLECCGHLSAFDINGQRYTQLFDDGMFPEDKDMNVKLGKIFSPGLQMEYEYDFGSTTDLRLTVVEERTGKAPARKILIMARNDPPEILCDECGQPATEICTMCLYEDAGLYCDKHAETHKCGTDYMLPVVNSPRAGVCGYTGETYV